MAMTEAEKNELRKVFERMLEGEQGYGQLITLSIDKADDLKPIAHRKNWTITIDFTGEWE